MVASSRWTRNFRSRSPPNCGKGSRDGCRRIRRGASRKEEGFSPERKRLSVSTKSKHPTRRILPGEILVYLLRQREGPMPPGYIALQLDLVNRRRENFIRKRPGKIDLVEAVARQQRGSFREGLVWQKGDRNRGEVAKVDVAAQSEIGVSLSKVCEINNRIPAFEGDAPGQAESVEKLTVDQIHAAGDQRLLQRIGRNQVATQDSP